MNSNKHAGLIVLAAALLAAPLAAVHAADAVQWSTTVTPVKAADGSTQYRLDFTGRITPGYIVYGSDFESGLGPNPTRVRYEPAAAVTPRERLLSTGARKGTDKSFNTPYTYFEGEAKLSQVVTVAAGARTVTGTIRGQTCHEADGTCQLFRASFELPLP
jgi:opacity protein-like surface antigen